MPSIPNCGTRISGFKKACFISLFVFRAPLRRQACPEIKLTKLDFLKHCLRFSVNGSLQFILEQMFVGPLWPASILVGLLIVYTAMALFGLIDFGLDVPEIDLDADVSLDVDVDIDVPDAIPTDWDFWQGIGAASIRATNFGRVPVIIWAGVFTLSYWTISYVLWHAFDTKRYEPNLLPSVLLSIRNIVIATVATKTITQPLIRYFVAGPSYESTGLVGATCEVCSLQATPDFGQAKFRTQAAPLLLNIRTDGPHFEKGEEVLITGFDRETRIYQVTSLPTESTS